MNQFEKQFLNPAETSAEEQSWRDLEKIIDELAARSPYKRATASPTTEIISARDEKDAKFSELGDLKIEQVKDPASPKVEGIVNFMNKFEPEEADPPEIIRDAIADPTGIYAYHIIENKAGEVIAHNQSSYLELEPPGEDEEASQAIIFNGFVITADDAQRKGLASELYQTMMRCHLEKAKAEGQEVKAIVAEGDADSEAFLNSVGLRRIYFEDNDGHWRELPYLQPPIEWNKRTGMPKGWKEGDDLKEFCIPENLMIRRVDGQQEMTMDELRPMLETIYLDNYVPYRNEGERYPTDKAIAKAQEIVDGFQQELEDAVSQAKDGKLYLFDAQEREQKMAEAKAGGREF